ncbi:site-specific integrase [Paracoccus sp. (in: a-proteobacteria)]|uniref:site-specific integrase n=1 Tax=Paracoccus sp. TaxID=267 RepID=UPI0032208027
MGIANYVIRRGYHYVWRRLYRGKPIQAPLGTVDPFQARRLAGVATAASLAGWNLLDHGQATLQTVAKGIRAAIQRERAAIEMEAAGMDPAPDGARAFFFFFLHDAPDDEPPKKPAGKTNGIVRHNHQAPAQAVAALPTPSPTPAKVTPVAPAVAAIAPKPRNAPTAAATAVPTQAPAEPEPAPERPRLKLKRGYEKKPRTKREPVTTTRPAGDGFSANILDVTERMSRTHARTNRANEKTLTQTKAVAALFCEVTGVTDVRKVKQRHLAIFVDAMDRLPPTYRRSEAERKKTIHQIMAEAEKAGVAVGMSVATINRNLSHLSKIFKAARGEGLKVDASIDPSLLRRIEKTAAKDQRDAFTFKDVQKLFAAPVWTGSKSKRRRREPGSVVIRDWLYWVPLIAAYSGARREEICGLETADISEEDGTPIMLIRPNGRRGLKNPQSKRRIPIHSHLIELGFLDYAQSQRDAGRPELFYDLQRKSAGSQIGDAIDYMWRNIQADQLGPQPKKSFHSFRHYAVQGLRAESDVEKHIRAELFGHLVGDIEDDRYGSQSPIEQLCVAVEALPRIF